MPPPVEGRLPRLAVGVDLAADVCADAQGVSARGTWTITPSLDCLEPALALELAVGMAPIGVVVIMMGVIGVIDRLYLGVEKNVCLMAQKAARSTTAPITTAAATPSRA